MGRRVNTQGRMHGDWWARSSLAVKLVVVTSVSTILIMAAIAAIMIWQGHLIARQAVQREMAATLEGVDRSMQLAYSAARQRADELVPVLERELGGRPIPDGSSDDSGVPLMIVADTIINGDLAHLMRMNENTGADASVIAKAPTGWVRVATMERNAQGDVQFNSVIPSGDLVVGMLDAGEPDGAVVLREGRWHALSVLPLKDAEGEIYGGLSVVLDVHEQVADVLQLVEQTRVAEHGRLALLGQTPSSGLQWIAAGEGSDMGLGESAARTLIQEQLDGATGFKEVSTEGGADHLMAWQTVDNWDWVLVGVGDTDAFMASSRQAMMAQMIMMVVGTVLITLLVGWLASRTLRPVRDIVQRMERLGQGDLTADTPSVPPNSRNEVHALYNYLHSTQLNLQRAIGTVRASVDEITLGADDIATGNIDLSSRTEQQAASLQQTAASMEELATVVRQNSDNAMQANKLALDASDVAEKGGRAVDGVVDSMSRISSGSSKIGEIVGVIDGIAFQTNILALNAAVEAARAGEHGKGFAVVASEVRSLAQRSAQAAKEIKTLIDASIDEVKAGEQQVKSAGTTMQELLASVRRVTQIMQEIAEASNEQSSGIEQVNTAVTQMDAATQQNAVLVQQAAAAADSMREQARRLSQAAAVFRLPGHVQESGQAILQHEATRQPERQLASADHASQHATHTGLGLRQLAQQKQGDVAAADAAPALELAGAQV